MSQKRLLLLSNSTNPGQAYLSHAREAVQNFLGRSVRSVVFIPYAGVRVTFDDYTSRVRSVFSELGYGLASVHEAENPTTRLREAEAIIVGGGNTFHLLKTIYDEGLFDLIRTRVLEGVPFVGWSAGANVACPTLCTTNDMPIVQPSSFEGLGLAPFQINPHFTDARLENHGGETRSERLEEYIQVNRTTWVIGLPEGNALHVDGPTIRMTGERPARIFRFGREPQDVQPGESLQFLMEENGA